MTVLFLKGYKDHAIRDAAARRHESGDGRADLPPRPRRDGASPPLQPTRSHHAGASMPLTPDGFLDL